MHSETVRRAQFGPLGARLLILPLFWIGLAIAMPVASLVTWCLFGPNSLGDWMLGDWEHRMMSASVAVVVVPHIGALAMLIAESRLGEGSPDIAV